MAPVTLVSIGLRLLLRLSDVGRVFVRAMAVSKHQQIARYRPEAGLKEGYVECRFTLFSLPPLFSLLLRKEPLRPRHIYRCKELHCSQESILAATDAP